jgi:hypothetical protein
VGAGRVIMFPAVTGGTGADAGDGLDVAEGDVGCRPDSHAAASDTHRTRRGNDLRVMWHTGKTLLLIPRTSFT